MINFEYLQAGDQIKATDEIQHRGRWESVTEYGIAGIGYSDGMKRIRRRVKGKE
jgi:hypothetical protein